MSEMAQDNPFAAELNDYQRELIALAENHYPDDVDTGIVNILTFTQCWEPDALEPAIVEEISDEESE